MVFNPAASGKDPAGRRDEIRSELDAAGLQAEWFETTESDAGDGIVKRLVEDGVELLFVAGGDGTVMACATALAGTDIPLALLPSGAGNLLALNLGIPLKLEDAVGVALRGKRRRIDVCTTGPHNFVVMAGLGFDAAMFRDTNLDLKNRIGPLAYVGGGLKHLRSPGTEVAIRIDDEPPLETVAHLVLIGNLGRIQGGLVVLPGAQPDDGLLHVAVVQAGSLMSWAKVAIRVLKKKSGDDPRVQIRTGKQVEVVARRPMPVQLDGDVLGEIDKLKVRVSPRALILCVPASTSRSE